MIKPENTRVSHHTALNNFERFCQAVFGRSKEDVIEEFREVERYVIFTTLQKWIQWNVENEINPSSIITWFSNLNTYFYYKGLELSQREIKENLDFPKKMQEDLYGVTPSDIESVIDVAKSRYRRIILAQKASLMREGELMKIRKKHLVFGRKRIMIKIPAEFTKLRKARTTFLDLEAMNANSSHISNLEDDDLVWGTDGRYDTKNYENAIRRYCEKFERLSGKYEHNGRNKITSHSFRAFGITKFSRHDENFAKIIAGQKGYLLQYDRLSDDEKLELYVKYEQDLIIDGTARKQTELDVERAEKTELKQKINEIEILKQQRESDKKEMLELLKDKLDEIKKSGYVPR